MTDETTALVAWLRAEAAETLRSAAGIGPTWEPAMSSLRELFTTSATLIEQQAAQLAEKDAKLDAYARKTLEWAEDIRRIEGDYEQRIAAAQKDEEIARLMSWLADMEQRAELAEKALDAAWAATGMAGTVRGLTTLDDVVTVQRDQHVDALARIAALEAELAKERRTERLSERTAHFLATGCPNGFD